jgi:ribosomal protein L24E
VADSTGAPYFPTSYTGYSIDDTGHLQIAGAFSTIGTTDHLVAVWQNSTDCSGSSISRNAWVADATGAITGENLFSGPPANNFGDMAGRQLNRPMVGMSPTADGRGYWLVASDGGIFAFGDARFHGSTGSIRLNKPVTGMAVTPRGTGYWMVASDGGIFAFNAPFYGSTGSLQLNKPIEAMIPTPDGRGYWMVASDGGIFAFGDATFHGSLGGRTLSAPIAGMIPNGKGYTLIGQDGQLYPFS